MTDALTVRAIEDSDWPAVSAIITEVLSAGETYAMPILDDTAARAFWFADSTVVVAEVDGQVVGSAKMGPNRPAQGAHIGTASFMVAEAARSRGVGRALGEHMLEWHHREGFRGVQFNAVVESNHAAVKLWQDLGFAIIGTVPGAFRRPSGDLVGLHVMYRDV